MRVRDICKKHGFREDLFERVCIQNGIPVSSFSHTIDDSSVERAVQLFQEQKEKIEEAERKVEEEKIRKVEEAREERRRAAQELLDARRSIIVTTADLHEPYEVIGPVYYQVNNAGGGGVFDNLCSQYADELREWEAKGQRSGDKISALETWGAFANALSILVGGPQDRDLMGTAHTSFDNAFYIATEELKLRAMLLGADAIVGMRQDIDLDTNGFQHFYLQMYGTAVKLKK